MKQILSFFTGLLSIFSSGEPPVVVSLSPTPVINNIGNFSYEYFTVEKTDALELHGNWNEKTSLKSRAEEKKCQSAINGGFYDTESQPLGLFVNSTLNKDRSKKSTLINGYVYNTQEGNNISRDLPQDIQWAVQTGPLLIEKGILNKLSMVNDKSARRSGVLTLYDKPNLLIFIIIFDNKFRLDGPTPGDLPNIINNISKLEKWNVETAINLDGGSASAFYDNQLYIPEFTYVGSFFCKKSLI